MKYWLIYIICLLSTFSNAQIQFTSLEDVLRYADANAITIQNALIGEQIAVAEKKEAKSYLLPKVNFSLGFNDNITLQPTLVPAQMFNPGAEEGTFEELTFGTKYLYSGGIQAKWDILDFQKIFAIKTADLKVQESMVSTEINRYNIYNKLASTYYSILLTKESIEIYQKDLEITESIFKHVQDKYDRGILNEAELNLAEIKHIQSENNLNQAQNTSSQLILQLQSQLNTNQDIKINDSPDRYILKDNTIRNIHPEVFLEEAKLKNYQSVLKQHEAMRYPSVSLTYQYNQNWATNNFMGFSNANHLPQQFFGVQISMPGLFNPSNKQKINQTKLKLQLQQQQLKNTILVKEKEDDMLKLELNRSKEQVAKNKRVLSLQQQNDEHAENLYLAGTISLDQRLDQYDDLLTAQDHFLQSMAEYTLAQYKIYIRQFEFKSK
jgi:outer membrane protein